MVMRAIIFSVIVMPPCLGDKLDKYAHISRGELSMLQDDCITPPTGANPTTRKILWPVRHQKFSVPEAPLHKPTG